MIDQKKSVKRSPQQDLETSKNGFNRRDFLGGGTLAVTATLVQGCTSNDNEGNGGKPEPEPDPLICFRPLAKVFHDMMEDYSFFEFSRITVRLAIAVEY